MGKIFLIRHGETASNAARRYISKTNDKLSKNGEGQAIRVTGLLSDYSIDEMYSSPLDRAIQTAQVIRSRLQQVTVPDIQVDDRLSELSFGAFEGLSENEIILNGMGGVYTRWRQGTPPTYPADAELFSDAAERARGFFEAKLNFSNKFIVVVSHSHLIKILLAVSVLGVSPDIHRRLRIDNGCAAVIEWEVDIPRIGKLNVYQ
jgi:broad specificity phosphatase PhoE